MIEARSISKFFSVINEKGLAEGLTAVLNVSLTIPRRKNSFTAGPIRMWKVNFP